MSAGGARRPTRLSVVAFLSLLLLPALAGRGSMDEDPRRAARYGAAYDEVPTSGHPTGFPERGASLEGAPRSR